MMKEGSERCDMRRTQPAIAGFEDGRRGHELRNMVVSGSCGWSSAYSQQENRDLSPSNPRNRILLTT